MKLQTLSPDQIKPPLVPARDAMDDEAFRELVADVREHGVRQPVTVVPAEGGFRLVAGHRRWLAAQAAGLATLPAVVKELDDAGEIGEMIAENLHREQLSPLEEGRVFQIYLEAFDKTTAEVASLVHKSPAYVASRLRILHAPDDVRQALREGGINLTVALELERCTHDGDRRFLLTHAVSTGATGDTVGRWVREYAIERQRQPEAPPGAASTILLQTPAVMMGACDWGKHQVPLNSTLSFNVCGDHYTFLCRLRDQVEAQEKGEPGAAG